MTETEHLHDLSGFFPTVPLGGGVELPVYFIVVSLAFCICLLWLVKRADARGMGRNSALDLSLVIMVAGFLGARGLHVVFEEPAYYLEIPSRVFEVWRGGFVWYGGALLATLAAFNFMYWKKYEMSRWCDLFAPVIALGYGLGRVACLFTGCCYGDVITLASGAKWRLPTQAFAVVWELLVVLVLIGIEKRPGRPHFSWFRTPGRLFLTWLLLHSIGRIIMESMRADPRGPEPWGLSLATWISLAIGIAAIGLFVRDYLRSRRS